MKKILPLIATLALASPIAAEAQTTDAATARPISIDGNFKWFQKTKNNTQSYPEYNIWVSNLPGKLGAYTWMDLNEDKTTFGKTEISRPISNGFEALSQIVHANEPFSTGGVGLKYNIPLDAGRNAYGNVKALPVWVGKDGTVQKGRALLGYAFGKDFKNGWSIETFAEFDFDSASKKDFAGKRHIDWGYGEFEVARQMGLGLKAALNAGLYNRGRDKLPEAKVRVEGRYDFSAKLPFWKKIGGNK